MAAFKKLWLLFLGLALLLACNKTDKTACTMEFRTVTIKVLGKKLTHWVTIRNSNSQRLNFGKLFEMDSLTYIVLDDSFQKTIENQTEKFTFKGYKNDLEVVNEVFTIGADKCHIYYIDGKQEVSL
jgi:uncharacterized membrane protein